MRCRVALSLTLAVAAGCQGPERREQPSAPEPPDPVTEARPHPAPSERPEPRLVSPGPGHVVGTDLSPDAILEHLRQAPAKRYRPVGRGELVFELELDAPVDALWVPRTAQEPHGWTRELAAWRIARCIGLDEVMPVARRDVTPEELRERLDPELADLWPEIEDRIAWDAGGAAPGAAVLLLRDVRPSGLGRRRIERWKRSLLQGIEPDEDRRRVHADLADMLLFDYLIANPSRLDHGVDALSGLERLVLRDHRDAFGPLRAADRDALREDVLGVEALTRPWAEGLARCDDARLSAVLRDGEGGHIVDPAELRSLIDRRRTLVSHVAALIDAHGPDEVVVLP